MAEKLGLDMLVDTAGKMAKNTARAAGNLVNKGYDKANELALNARLDKMHRQLGALVYALRKNGEQNEPMINWYVAEIDRLKEKMGKTTTLWQDEPEGDVYSFGQTAAKTEDDEDAMFCGGDGDELP